MSNKLVFQTPKESNVYRKQGLQSSSTLKGSYGIVIDDFYKHLIPSGLQFINNLKGLRYE